MRSLGMYTSDFKELQGGGNIYILCSYAAPFRLLCYLVVYDCAVVLKLQNRTSKNEQLRARLLT